MNKQIALLIPFHNTITKVNGWIWQTPNYIDLSQEFLTKQEALNHKPKNYKLLDDGWHPLNS